MDSSSYLFTYTAIPAALANWKEVKGPRSNITRKKQIFTSIVALRYSLL